MRTRGRVEPAATGAQMGKSPLKGFEGFSLKEELQRAAKAGWNREHVPVRDVRVPVARTGKCPQVGFVFVRSHGQLCAMVNQRRIAAEK